MDVMSKCLDGSRPRTARDSSEREWKDVAPLLPRLACPACHASGDSLEMSTAVISCRRCNNRYPVYPCGEARVPWLFAEPDSLRLEWKARYLGFARGNSAKLERLRRLLAQGRCSATGRRRIEQLIEAHERYREQIDGILAPLDLESINWPAEVSSLLTGKLPRNQDLGSYTVNVFRDWVWNNGENTALIEAVDAVWRKDRRMKPGSMLTLGAGAGRLAYDMHLRYSPTLSIVSDFNPLLLQIGCRVVQGEEIPLYEFPVAPLDQASFAVLQNCRSPAALKDDNYFFVFADAFNPPFAGNSIDTLITPWLIDIIPHDLGSFIPRINQLLTTGGVWINTGSLAFYHLNEYWCYSEEEVLELAVENGFEILAVERRKIDYLQSPHSAHGRTEKILSFAARKVRDVDPGVSPDYLPDWILDTSRAIPTSAEHGVLASSNMLKAQVLAAIDGRRSIHDISCIVADHYGLGIAETNHAVKRILADVWEDRQKVKPDGPL